MREPTFHIYLDESEYENTYQYAILKKEWHDS